MSARDAEFMRAALQCAEQAAAHSEVPVGAVVVRGDEIIARAANQPITGCDPTAHAEVVALRAAAKALGNYRLVECELFVTLEPCLMCAGAIVHSRVQRLVFGAHEPKAGVISSQLQVLESTFLNHRVAVESGVLALECGDLISQFFHQRRQKKRALKQNHNPPADP
ncbi:tRNA adenosine(34) deaminase TadA [Halioxenophilus aromaticivorans]|uniref:tRNA-specific adenosine deaminase n=1 Tax=Halioxenophilus aromaticivorans TaxID=1306992 RepID=A0AAV3TZ22_9ALTE